MSPELRQECIEVIENLLEYVESEFMGSEGIIGEAGKSAERADRLLLELKRP